MLGAGKQQLEDLRARIATLEKRLEPADSLAFSALSSEAEPGPLDIVTKSHGLLHEVFAADLRLSGTALGFAFGMARPLLSPSRPALLYVQLAADSQETGFPYAPGFNRFGLDPGQIVLCRVENIVEFLWAMEEAIGCQAIAAVVADVATPHKALDFTASRRLTLRISASRTTTFLLRYGTGREASAAKLRWRVEPGLSAAPDFDPLAPGPPRFVATLEKSRLGVRAQRLEGRSFELDWTDHGFVVVEHSGLERTVVRRPAPPSRPQPATVGYRLSETG
jgi:protein ImuA